jgi:hypothetical protein
MKQFLKGAASVVGMVAVVAVFAGGAYLIKHPPQPVATAAQPAGYTDVAMPSPSPSPTPNTFDSSSGSATAPLPDPTPTAAPSGPVKVGIGGGLPDHAGLQTTGAAPREPNDTAVFINQGTYEVAAGTPLTLKANWQMGFPGVPVTFAWSGCPEVAGLTGESITVTFATPGTYKVSVTATQVNGGFAYEVPTAVPSTVIVS